MRQSRVRDEQIIGVLKEAEAGTKVGEICGKHGISEQTYYPAGRDQVRRTGGERSASAAARRGGEDENRGLKPAAAGWPNTRWSRDFVSDALTEGRKFRSLNPAQRDG